MIVVGQLLKLVWIVLFVDVVKYGIVLIIEDCKGEGLLLLQLIIVNVLFGQFDWFVCGGIVDLGCEMVLVEQ